MRLHLPAPTPQSVSGSVIRSVLDGFGDSWRISKLVSLFWCSVMELQEGFLRWGSTSSRTRTTRSGRSRCGRWSSSQPTGTWSTLSNKPPTLLSSFSTLSLGRSLFIKDIDGPWNICVIFLKDHLFEGSFWVVSINGSKRPLGQCNSDQSLFCETFLDWIASLAPTPLIYNQPERPEPINKLFSGSKNITEEK